jgi:serine/threonine protein kinase
MMEKSFCPLCEREYEPGSKFCLDDGSELIFRSEDAMAGQVFDGRYRILHKLGEGGMGAIYKAVQISTQKPVAIKVVAARHAENESTIRRFQREVKLQSKLEHPNIVTVIDFAKTPDGQYFFAMPFIEGKSLRRMILDAGKFSLPDFLALAMQICDGLECAHAEGIVHRDLKGDNIVVAHIGRQRVAKILDFGLAKAIQQGDDTAKSGPELTSVGMAMGTPAYMSPEQAKGEGDKIGSRSDLYSLGVIFYQMLTGSLPFRSDTPWGVMHQHISEPPVPLRQINPDAPESIERAIMRLLEKEPEKRYPSALALRRDLEMVARTTPGLMEATAPEETPTIMQPRFAETLEGKPTPRSRGPIVVLLALLLAMAGGGYWLYGRGGGATEPSTPAPVAVVKPGTASAPESAKPAPVAVVKQETPAAPVQESAKPASSPSAKRQPVTTPEPKAATPETKTPVENAADKAEREKRGKIAGLLAEAEADMKAKRVTEPEGRNAMEKYEGVLELDPANEKAKWGMNRVADYYLELAAAAAGSGDFGKAEEFIALAEEIVPESAKVTSASANVAEMKARAKEKEAGQRMKAWDKIVRPKKTF